MEVQTDTILAEVVVAAVEGPALEIQVSYGQSATITPKNLVEVGAINELLTNPPTIMTPSPKSESHRIRADATTPKEHLSPKSAAANSDLDNV